MTRAQLCGLSVVPEVDMPSITEPSEDADMDEDDAPKTVSKPKAAPKKAGNGRKTRAQVRAGSELMVVSVQVEDADMDGDEAPKVVVKPKIAAKKPQTIRKTRGQTVLSQIAEAGTQEEEFYDAEEEPVKVKTEEVESEVEEEQIQEPVQPVKKATRGHPAKKVPDDNMVVEEGMFQLPHQHFFFSSLYLSHSVLTSLSSSQSPRSTRQTQARSKITQESPPSTNKARRNRGQRR